MRKDNLYHEREEMNRLLSIEQKNDKPMVNARDLWEKLESQRQFANWIQQKIETYGLVEGEDFLTDLLKSSGGRPAKEYYLSLNTAKELAMVENNQKGREIRQYLIKVEEAWNTPTMVMARGLQASQKLIADFRNQIAILEPKAKAYDRIADSTGLHTLGEAAKILGWGRNLLFSQLRKDGIFFLQKNNNRENNLPYQAFIERGYFKVIEEPYRDDGKDCLYPRIYITAKGLTWLAQKYQTAGVGA